MIWVPLLFANLQVSQTSLTQINYLTIMQELCQVSHC